MNKQKQPKKLSNISLGIIAVAMVGMVLPSLQSANAQNTTTTETIDVESVKPHLDEAKKFFDSGNYAEALKHIDLAENQLDIADDIIEVKLGQN